MIVAMVVLRGCIAKEFGLGSLGLHCFLRLSSAGLIVVLVPGCCWAWSAFSVLHDDHGYGGSAAAGAGGCEHVYRFGRVIIFTYHTF